MRTNLPFAIAPQPDETTCGPTCLHAVYRYFGDDIALARVVAEVPVLAEGGTLAVLLGCHALARGYRATIYTYKLQIFDPSWFAAGAPPMAARLREQLRHKQETRLQAATHGYLEFLERGGELKLEDLNAGLLRRWLKKDVPLITGLSATWLYRTMREYGPRADYDDVRGEPVGHFVVLHGYDAEERTVAVADPLEGNPWTGRRHYTADMDRLVTAILLGVLTYDANLLVIPRRGRRAREQADPDRRRRPRPLAAGSARSGEGHGAGLCGRRTLLQPAQGRCLQPLPQLPLPEPRLLRVAARGGPGAPAGAQRLGGPGPEVPDDPQDRRRRIAGAGPEEPGADPVAGVHPQRLLRPQPGQALRPPGRPAVHHVPGAR